MSSTAPLPCDSTAARDALSQLTSAQQLRLTEVLDCYLSALETGAPLDQRALLAAHPDLAASLQTYFRSLEELHRIAAGFGGGDRTPDEAPANDCTGDTGPLRVGEFELLRELGRGGMGVVYEARQRSLQRLVAVKILPFASVFDSRQISRFKHEAQAAARLHHPHIVPVFAIGEERGVHYYAMQLVQGQSLETFLIEMRRTRLRPPRDYFTTIAEWARQAADALQAAHEAGIVHRDIKPSNLLIDEQKKLWVTDFGLARVEHDLSLTRTGDLVGTLRYMSPEQAAGNALLVDHRADVYSLGATLYELATLQPAYGSEQGAALLRKMESCSPPLPRSIRSAIPRPLESIIVKAMARERDQRYATAAELAADLQRFLQGEPVHARPPSLLGRGQRCRPPQARWLLMLLLLWSVGGLGYVVRSQGSIAAPASAAPGEQPITSPLDPRRELAIAQNRLGLEMHGARRTREAAEAFANAVVLHRELLAAEPDSAELHSRLANSYSNWSVALSDDGDSRSALEQLAQAITYQQRAVELQPANQRYTTLLHRHRELQQKIRRRLTTSLELTARDIVPTGH
jgi:serine/threonine protein kinase/2-oxo-4-hydroxy-4-carboxy--5-ureidoimidazoline (OHCU) decarboxylase